MGAPAPNQTMAIISNSSGWSDRRYYEDQELRYSAEMERQRMNAVMQQQAYNPYTDPYGGLAAQQHQEAKKPVKAAQPDYLDNIKLLLLGEAT